MVGKEFCGCGDERTCGSCYIERYLYVRGKSVRCKECKEILKSGEEDILDEEIPMYFDNKNPRNCKPVTKMCEECQLGNI